MVDMDEMNIAGSGGKQNAFCHMGEFVYTQTCLNGNYACEWLILHQLYLTYRK